MESRPLPDGHLPLIYKIIYKMDWKLLILISEQFAPVVWSKHTRNRSNYLISSGNREIKSSQRSFILVAISFMEIASPSYFNEMKWTSFVGLETFVMLQRKCINYFSRTQITCKIWCEILRKNDFYRFIHVLRTMKYSGKCARCVQRKKSFFKHLNSVEMRKPERQTPQFISFESFVPFKLVCCQHQNCYTIIF